MMSPDAINPNAPRDISELHGTFLKTWSLKTTRQLAKAGQLRLEIPNADMHLQVEGVIGLMWRTKKVKPLEQFGVGLLDPEAKVHSTVVAKRAAAVLTLAVTQVWASPDYVADDKQKLINKVSLTTIEVLNLLVMAGLAVSVVGILTVGLPVMAGAGGLIAGFLPFWTAISVTNPIWMTLAGNVFGMMSMFYPGGIPLVFILSGHQSYVTQLMSKATLERSEQEAALAVATAFCPLGSSHAEKPEDPSQDQYANCRRHKLKLKDKKKIKSQRSSFQKISGVKFEKESIWGKIHSSKERKVAKKFFAAAYHMKRLAEALNVVSDMNCGVVVDHSRPDKMKYTLHERWTLMPKPKDLNFARPKNVGEKFYVKPDGNALATGPDQ